MQRCCLRIALTASFVGSGILGCPSLVVDGCPTCLVLRWLLVIFHRFLSLVPVGSGGGRILRLIVDINRFVVLLLSAAIQISRSIVSHPFWTVFLRNGNARSLHFDWQAACWANEDLESRFVYFLLSSSGAFNRHWATFSSMCFFPLNLLKSFLDDHSNRMVAGSHNQILFCCHPGGLESAHILIGLQKWGVGHEEMLDFNVFFHLRGIFCLGLRFEPDLDFQEVSVTFLSGCFGVLMWVIVPLRTTSIRIGHCISRQLFLLPLTLAFLECYV